MHTSRPSFCLIGQYCSTVVHQNLQKESIRHQILHSLKPRIKSLHLPLKWLQVSAKMTVHTHHAHTVQALLFLPSFVMLYSSKLSAASTVADARANNITKHHKRCISLFLSLSLLLIDKQQLLYADKFHCLVN